LVSLTQGGKALEATDEKVSSVVDTWLLVRDIEIGGERNRGLYVLKSRGMAHSNQIREFLITSNRIKLVPVYLGQSGVLTGSARLAQENLEKEQQQTLRDEVERKALWLEHRRKLVDAQIATIEAEFKREEEEFTRSVTISQARQRQMNVDRVTMAQSRREKVLNGK
jgi:circadian clock protein KaiC